MSVEKSLPEMRTEATSLLASGSELFEEGDYTTAAAQLGSASELFAKVLLFRLFIIVFLIKTLFRFSAKLRMNVAKLT